MMDVYPCSSAANLVKPSLKGSKVEVEVELCADHYLVVSCFVNGHRFHGILLKAQTDAHAPFGVDGKKFDEWKNLEINNRRNASWDSDKLSSLCLRQTCFDDSKFDSLKVRHSQGIRRLDSRPVRLRPVASQRSTVLCARCQQQRVAISSRHGQNHFASSSFNQTNSKRTKQDGPSLTSFNSEHKKRERPKANAQFIFERLFAKKQVESATVETANHQKTAQITSPPPPPRVPTLKITFGKSESKTVTVINGRSPSISISSSSSSSHSTNSEKPANQSNSRDSRAEKSETQSCSTKADDSPPELEYSSRPGDIVWAKMQSYPYWPAKVFDIYDRMACVTWCGSTQYGYVDVSILEPFVKLFNKRYNAKRNGAYQKAVADAVCQFDEIKDNAYYISLLSPACRKFVCKQKNRAVSEKIKPSQTPLKGVKEPRIKLRPVEISGSATPKPSSEKKVPVASQKSAPSTSEPAADVELDLRFPCDSPENSPDASPRLIIDECVEESYENFAKRSRLSTDAEDIVGIFSPSDPSSQTSANQRMVPTKGQAGAEVDFDSVLSELQEMNDMCAAGSTSLLTSC